MKSTRTRCVESPAGFWVCRNFLGKTEFGFQEEIAGVPEAVDHASDHFDTIVYPFQHVGMHVQASAGENV